MPPLRLSATWVLPITAPPIRDGAVLVDEAGRIAAVGPDDAVPAPPGVPSERFEDAVLLPGLVNAHTHLELTGLAGTVREASFPDWIRKLRQVKAERSYADFLAAAKQGIRDCWAAGVTTVADTGDSGAVIEALAELGGRGVSYHEVFGPHPGQVDESMAGLRCRVEELRRFTSERVRLGVSPHAPYTVSRELYRSVASW
ncbi:MAG: amidohydrolase family protein, partial [Gemmatimonadales bacterium]